MRSLRGARVEIASAGEVSANWQMRSLRGARVEILAAIRSRTQ